MVEVLMQKAEVERKRDSVRLSKKSQMIEEELRRTCDRASSKL